MLLAAQTTPPPAQNPADIETVKTTISVVEKLTTEVPASVTVVDQQGVQKLSGVNLDDRLRMVPGFSLFRRSSGLVAHPTTQGLSLRGIGSSGASRTLVLWDGIPLNDPFGGWVYWTRVSPDEVGRIEISRGASTSVFGDRALGGVVSLFSREPEKHRLTGEYEVGNRNTHTASAGYSHLFQRMAVSGMGRAFTTNGYILVPEPIRGRVDREATVRFVTGAARLDWIGANDRAFFKSDLLAEERGNGTVLQRNSTSMGSIGGNYLHQWSRDTVSAVGYHIREEFRSSFSSIAANRQTETISFLQTVPADATGGSAFWQHTANRFSSIAGADFNRVEGKSIDRFPTITRVGEGSLFQHGTFLQGDFKAGPARFFLGARHHVPSSDRQFFSPSAGGVVGHRRLRARGSVYRSFRAATLNELYRDFRQGNAVTLANAELRPERVFGAEVGFDFVGESSRAGVTFFRNDLRDLVSNVTLRTTPAEITRQRQNASRALNRGFEVNLSHGWRDFRAEASYLFADSRFSTSLRIPQIPKHQGSAQVTWIGRKTLASAGFRTHAFQFDDDLNRLLLPGFATSHFTVRHKLFRELSAVVAAENVFNREYYVAFTPVPQTGTPRLFRAGLRWDGRLW